MWINSEGTLHQYGLGMAPGTSPSMMGCPGGYLVAFQANNHNLYIFETAKGQILNTGLGMAAGTSPSITPESHGYNESGPAYEVAFQANTGNMNTYNSVTGWHNYGLGMKAGTSPSIAPRFNYGEDTIAFQSVGGYLFTFTPKTANLINTWQGMAAGTSPSISEQ